MSNKQKIVEEIAYLKLWLSVFLVTLLSLGGWIMTRVGTTSPGLFICAATAFIGFFVMCALLHIRIKLEIDRLENE